MRPLRELSLALAATSLLFTLQSCKTEKETSKYQEYRDTTLNVYGPYIALKLPISKGVKMGNPIQLSLGPGGFLFASNQTGEVYTLHDSDGDGIEDSTALFCNVKEHGLRSPAGLAFRADTVYVGTAQEIRAYLDINNDLKADTSWTFFNGIPTSEHPYEWTSGIQFGPDGWLYAAITTDSWNAGAAADPSGLRGSIIRIAPNGKKYEVVARGIRSVPGMAFNDNGDLFFADNEGGGNPTEELNRLEPDAFYGHNKKKYPADSGSVKNPEFNFISEVAPSSIEFNRGDNSFGGTAGDMFVSYYGPGERWTRGAIGRIVVKKQPDNRYSFEEYTIADIPKLSDLAFGKDGSLYVAHHGEADYWYNAIYKDQGGFYKLIYDSTSTLSANYTRPKLELTFSANSAERGKQLFAELGCLGCHHVDGKTELLGPNLKDVAKNFSREEILEEILHPSRRIKPSMGGMRITKKGGQVLLGRAINSDNDGIDFMVVGNQVTRVQRSEIEKIEDEKKSLMFENLLAGSSDEDREALIDFLVSLNE